MSLSRARIGRRVGLRVVTALLILVLILPMVLGRFAGCDALQAVTVWHAFEADSPQARSLGAGLEVLAAEGTRIRLRITAQGDKLGTALAAAAQAGTLPDIVIAPAELAPALDRGGSTYRFPLTEGDDWLPGVRGALVRGGQLIGLPLFCSTQALVRSPSLAAEPWPADLEALAAAVSEAQSSGQGGFYWPAGDVLSSLPFYLGAGGALEPVPPQEQDPAWTAVPAVARAAALRWLAAAGALASLPASGAAAPALADWQQAKVAYAILDPAQYAALSATGIRAGVGPLPGGIPLLTTWAMLLMRDEDELSQAAVELAIRLASDGGDGLLYLSSVMTMLPPMASHFGAEVVKATGLDGFKALAEKAVAMPAGQYASGIWAAYEQCYADWRGGAKAEDAVARLIERVGQLVAGSSAAP